jgi:hypothetical protein
MKLEELAGFEHLHHAYLVAGGLAEDVFLILKKRKVSVVGNSDIYSVSISEFGIDLAREIATFASLKALSEHKFVVVSWSRATAEAQNALLKVVEEAPGSTVFFFCVESVGHVLPTLRSRTIVVSAKSRVKSSDSRDDAEEFLEANYEKRLAAVEKMTGYISKTQDRVPVRHFVQGLLSAARRQGVGAPYLRDLLDADRYMRMQGSSAKAVLSHVAVTLPRVT